MVIKLSKTIMEIILFVVTHGIIVGSNDVGYLVKATSQGDTIWRKNLILLIYRYF